MIRVALCEAGSPDVFCLGVTILMVAKRSKFLVPQRRHKPSGHLTCCTCPVDHRLFDAVRLDHRKFVVDTGFDPLLSTRRIHHEPLDSQGVSEPFLVSDRQDRHKLRCNNNARRPLVFGHSLRASLDRRGSISSTSEITACLQPLGAHILTKTGTDARGVVRYCATKNAQRLHSRCSHLDYA